VELAVKEMSAALDAHIMDSQKVLFSDVLDLGSPPEAAACTDKHLEMQDKN
jgi:hypothetical protein